MYIAEGHGPAIRSFRSEVDQVMRFGAQSLPVGGPLIRQFDWMMASCPRVRGWKSKSWTAECFHCWTVQSGENR